MKRREKLVLFLALLLTAGLSRAATYEIDPGHSEVGFRIRHIVSKVRGRFEKFSGSIDFDEKKPTSLRADATVETASINTSQTKRDEHLRSPDFFNAEKFPTMMFKSSGAKAVSDNKIQLTGNLTLLGVTKPVTLDVEIGGVQKDPRGNTRAGFSATGKINRKDFGMVWNKALDTGSVMLGDEVEILLEVEAVSK